MYGTVLEVEPWTGHKQYILSWTLRAVWTLSFSHDWPLDQTLVQWVQLKAYLQEFVYNSDLDVTLRYTLHTCIGSLSSKNTLVRTLNEHAVIILYFHFCLNIFIKKTCKAPWEVSLWFVFVTIHEYSQCVIAFVEEHCKLQVNHWARRKE